MIVVTGSARGAALRAAQAMIDPTLTPVTVTTDEPNRGAVGVSARSENEFLASWRSLVGIGRLDLARGDEQTTADLPSSGPSTARPQPQPA